MLHDCRYELAVLDDGEKLLRNGSLSVLSLLLPIQWQAHIDCRALGGDNLHSDAFLAQVDLTTVGTVDEDRGYLAEDLKYEGSGGGDGE